MSGGNSPTLEVRDLDDTRRPECDGFVRDRPDATVSRLNGWKPVIGRSVGHRCYFLAAVSRDRIRGVLPLAHVASRLFGNNLVSNAICVYGGPSALDDVSRAALEGAARQLANRLSVDHLEYRLRAPLHHDWAHDADLYVTFRTAMDPNPEENLAAIPRKAIKLRLRSEVDAGVARFCRLFSESARNLGTPVFSRRYFHNLKQAFGPACEILTIAHGDRPISSVISLLFRDEILPYYGGGTSEARRLAASDFTYWEVVRKACQGGACRFDFDRGNRGTGSFSFKKNWGFKPKPQPYEYKLMRRGGLHNLKPRKPKFQRYISVWKRLPLGIANLIGPVIARDLA